MKTDPLYCVFSMSVSGTVLRIITFLLHFGSAIFLLNLTFRCSNVFKTNVYTETVTDNVGYALIMNSSCYDPYDRECFYGLPQSYDVIQYSLSWNVFALLSAFEWLSASFALFYLKDVLKHWLSNASEMIIATCLIWNAIGIFTHMPYGMPLTMLQAGITALSLLAASASQITFMLPIEPDNHSTCTPEGRGMIVPPTSQLKRNTPDGTNQNVREGNRVIQHYTEYCTSASLLFVAVLILFVPDPVAWAPLFGFTGIMICNITGIGAHNCKLDLVDDSPATPWYDLDWTKCGNHFKLFLLHSWLALLGSIMIIIYLARDSLTSSDVPVWVRFILWNLLVTYTLFGVWATLCYTIAGARNSGKHFTRWMERLDYGLTVLSVAAKLPVAYTVYYGLVQGPGEGSCSS